MNRLGWRASLATAGLLASGGSVIALAVRAQVPSSAGDRLQDEPAAAAPAQYLIRAREAMARGDAPTALAELERLAEISPGDTEVEALLGSAHMLAHRAHPAIGHLERARAGGRADAHLLTQLAVAYWEVNRLEDAERTFHAALVAGGGPAVAGRLGRLLHWQGRSLEALPLLQLGSRAGLDLELHLDLAAALAATGRQDEAAAAYRELAVRAPERPEVLYRLARLQIERGEDAGPTLVAYESARRQSQRRRREEGLARARLDEGWDLFRRGHPAAALVVFSASPVSVESLCGVAFASSALGDHAAAVAALEHAVALAPERYDLHEQLATERRAAGARAGDVP